MKNSKSMIMIVGLLAAMFFGYMMFFNAGDEAPAESPAESTPHAGDELLALLEKLKNIRMDGRIFSSQAFMSLEDRSRSVESEPVGRNNPFSPVGTDGFFVATGFSREAPVQSGQNGTSTATSTPSI